MAEGCDVAKGCDVISSRAGHLRKHMLLLLKAQTLLAKGCCDKVGFDGEHRSHEQEGRWVMRKLQGNRAI